MDSVNSEKNDCVEREYQRRARKRVRGKETMIIYLMQTIIAQTKKR